MNECMLVSCWMGIQLLGGVFQIHMLSFCRGPAARGTVHVPFRAPRMGARGGMALVALRGLQTARAFF